MEGFLEERFVEMAGRQAGRHSKPEKEPGQHGRAVQGGQFRLPAPGGTSGGSQSLAVLTQHDNIS